MSGSKEIEAGARATLLLAVGLFRLDVAIVGDTLRTVVRNLSVGELTMAEDRSGYAGPTVASAEVAGYEPTASTIGFAVGRGDDRVEVEVLLGTLRFADRGVYRVTAQAIVRQAPTAD